MLHKVLEKNEEEKIKEEERIAYGFVDNLTGDEELKC